MKTDVSDCISRSHQTKFGSTSLPCDITKASYIPYDTKPSVLLFHDTTPRCATIGHLFWNRIGCVLDYWTTFTTWRVLRQFLGKLFLNTFTTFQTPLSMFFFRKWNWHFARTTRLPYPECQCLKPPLFGGKLMDWQKCYKWRTSPSHIIYLARLRLLLATSFMPHFAFFAGLNSQSTSWNRIPKSSCCSRQLAKVHIFGKSSQGVEEKLEQTWLTQFETNKKRS